MVCASASWSGNGSCCPLCFTSFPPGPVGERTLPRHWTLQGVDSMPADLWPRLGGITDHLGNDGLSQILQSVLENIIRLPWLAMNAGGIFVNHPQEGYLELLAQINFTPYIAGTCSRVLHGHCLCGRVALTGRLLHVDCVDERHETRYEGMSDHGHYVVPIRWGEALLGIMVLYIAVHHPFDEKEAKVLEDFARLVGLLIHTWQVRRDMALADQILIHSTHGILITDEKLKIQWINRALERMSGYRLNEIVGKTPELFASGRHGPDFYREMWRQIETEGHWEGEIWNRDKEGRIHPQWLSILCLKDRRGKTLRYAGLYVDLSEIRAAEEKIRQLAYFDQVTGLPNLNWLREVMPAQPECLGDGEYLILLLLSAKDFQEINATLGHRAGDTVLREISRRLKDGVVNGVVARTGTEEFAVVWRSEDEPERAISHKVQDLTRRLASPFWHAYQSLDLRCRMGAGWSRVATLDIEALLKQTASALSECRRRGDASDCVIYDQDLGSKVRRRHRLTGLLAHAIDRNEFSLRFQPQVNAQGKLVGAEVLLRWENAEYGNVPPDFFISLAEESGKIVEIGTWVLEETLRHIQRWRAEAAFGEADFPHMAINLSPLQLMSPHVVNHFIRTCQICKEWPGSIELEVTESSMEHHFEVIVQHIRQLADHGFKIAIDDFGTGHSSLARLHQFPLHVIKIDRSFVLNMKLGSTHVTLIKSIVEMAHG
ncbi:MAG TPA: EAL domain-containing protein, partial [Methylothermaceae bacterium]|nr:EAL domain-containing protein [Methylothermaceae bacterium]